MGSGLVRRLTAAGHTVLLTDRNADKAANVAAQAGDGHPGRASAAGDAEALAADVVVLAIWYPGTVEYATANSATLSGKVVVDISNPLDDSFTGLTIDPTTSAAEQLAAALPDSSVVKAFNTVTSTVLPVGELDGTPSDTFVASDDDKAKATVLELLEGTGLRGLDAGKLPNARLLERLTAFGIELGQRYGLEFDFAFKYLPATEMTPNG
jgi:NADPH-dependent F420 reductase